MAKDPNDRCGFPGCDLLRSSVQHIKDGPLSLYPDSRWHAFVEPEKAKDWASGCAERWVDDVSADPNRVLGAIQETIERAALAAIERAHDLGIPADKQLSIGEAIRGLG